MKTAIRTRCPIEVKLIKIIRHVMWFSIQEKGLHCPKCKTFFKFSQRGECALDVLIRVLATIAAILGVLLILKGLFGCTPFY